MKEFAFGSDIQFESLAQMLQDNLCHVYNDCVLPEGCTPKKARIGFEKNTEGHYIMYINKGIISKTGHADFDSFIEKGEKRFICCDDMVSFLRSLQPLFETDVRQNSQQVRRDQNRTAGGRGQLETVAADLTLTQEKTSPPVYDPNRVKKLKAEEEAQKMVWPEEISEPLKKKIFGQDDVIDEIANQIVINRMGKEKKILVMALVGPTATGKSETAKSLADILTAVYETPYGYIGLRGSEFLEEASVARLFGAAPGYVGYGKDTALHPVRKNKKQVIVFDEIEKAHLKLLDGLMEAIDTGFLGMADNSEPIDLSECILLFTSNIPIDMKKYQTLSKFEREEMCRDVFTKHCRRPEISGKIGNFLVFNELSFEARLDILVKFIQEELGNYDLTLAGIDEHLLLEFMKYQTKYGARGIRSHVNQTVGLQLMKNRKRDSMRNKKVRMTGTMDDIVFRIA